MSYRVLVTVGTDHHSFDRLMDWVDRWADQNPDCPVVVQHGSSRPPSRVEGRAFFSNEELLAQMEAADVVVTHGGPATITETRRRRRVPVCVPRDPARDEHVDDHQQRFARFLDRQGLVRLVLSEEDFVAALADPDALRVDSAASQDDTMPEGVRRVGEIVAALVIQHRAR
ncbi:MAG: glycosyltransferase [Actinomycetes bacterium]